MVAITSHGGRCCGMSHIYGFSGGPNSTYYDGRKMCKFGAQFEALMKGKGKGHTLEATLTDDQMVAWAPLLKKHGFKHVHRFRNRNSHNYVNVLLHCTSRSRKAAPFDWAKIKPEETAKSGD